MPPLALRSRRVHRLHRRHDADPRPRDSDPLQQPDRIGQDVALGRQVRNDVDRAVRDRLATCASLQPRLAAFRRCQVARSPRTAGRCSPPHFPAPSERILRSGFVETCSNRRAPTERQQVERVSLPRWKLGSPSCFSPAVKLTPANAEQSQTKAGDGAEWTADTQWH